MDKVDVPSAPLTLDVHALAKASDAEKCVKMANSQTKDANTLARNATSMATYLILCLTFIVFEMSKQVVTYAVRDQNDGKYPLDQTALVAIVEFIKLTIVTSVYLFKTQFTSTSGPPNPPFKFSIRFVVPSLLYAVNNNLYYLALTLVAPPIWMIIIQSRVVLTAFVYKFVFKREVTGVQWLGTVFIAAAVVINELPNLFSTTHIIIPLSAVFLSLLSACTSCAAAVYAEMLLKSSNMPFLNQQIQLYFFGFIISFVVHLVTTQGSSIAHCEGCSGTILVLMIACLVLNSAGGMIVAAIIKLLDNIVKIYTSAIANILTAMLCTIFFPDNFRFNMIFLVSLMALFVGIYLYEVKKLPNKLRQMMH